MDFLMWLMAMVGLAMGSCKQAGSLRDVPNEVLYIYVCTYICTLMYGIDGLCSAVQCKMTCQMQYARQETRKAASCGYENL